MSLLDREGESPLSVRTKQSDAVALLNFWPTYECGMRTPRVVMIARADNRALTMPTVLNSDGLRIGLTIWANDGVFFSEFV